MGPPPFVGHMVCGATGTISKLMHRLPRRGYIRLLVKRESLYRHTVWYIMVSNTTFGGMIRRNPSRVRRVPRRTSLNPADSMTPQGHAVWASRNIDNAFGFIGPVFQKMEEEEEEKISLDEANYFLKDILE